MIELFTRLRHILIPRHSSSSASASRPPCQDPSTAVDPEVVVPLSGLARLPLEILLQVIQYLPAESAAAVALISKYHYLALKQDVLPGLADTAAKKRFLRLLEVDLADYIACHRCDILYRWKASAPRYRCPRRYHHGMWRLHTSEPIGTYCPEHYPRQLPLETVAAFLRGYERGPAYGPQLQELHHKCTGAALCGWPRNISRETAARVVNGRLLLRVSCNLQVSLQKSLAVQLDQLTVLGCCHSSSLPALVMDAIDHLGTPSEAPRSSDYINCAECATDLRVAVRATNSVS